MILAEYVAEEPFTCDPPPRPDPEEQLRSALRGLSRPVPVQALSAWLGTTILETITGSRVCHEERCARVLLVVAHPMWWVFPPGVTPSENWAKLR